MQNAESVAGISDAIVESIQTKQYPASDNVAGAQLSRPILEGVTTKLKEAKAHVLSDISKYSREVGPNVDGWIKQAKRLQEDIENSRKVAREIVQGADEAARLKEKQEDASKTARLLQGEVDFHQTLGNVLQQTQEAAGALKDCQDSVEKGDVEKSLGSLQLVQKHFELLRSCRSTHAIQLLMQRAERLRGTVADETKRQWNSCLSFDMQQQSFTVQEHPENSVQRARYGFETIIAVTQELDIFQVIMQETTHNLDTQILGPVLSIQRSSRQRRISVSAQTIRLTSSDTSTSPFDILEDLSVLINFLRTNLPAALAAGLAGSLMPSIVDRLLENWLHPSVPVELSAIPEYDRLLKAVSDFASDLASSQWPGPDKLQAWVEDAPPVWLARRRESALGAVRQLLSREIRTTKTVERVETQQVAGDETINSPNGDAEDWGTAWGDDADDTTVKDTSTLQKAKSPDEDQDGDDGAAWDMDADADETANASTPQDNKPNGDDDDGGDAWGWDEPSSPNQTKTLAKAKQDPATPQKPTQGSRTKELTLRETYTITSIPDALCSLITQVANDAEALRAPEYADCSIAPAALGLYSLPTLILAGYRALSPPFYQELPGGNMFIYNDTIRLVETLQDFITKQQATDEASTLPRSAWPTTRMKLDADISALKSFGRRAYGKEMDSERTILRDLLDGAQGFANCTEQPYASECETAISATTDRVRQVAKEWTGILSRSALLQSTGSLLSTILNKFIVDVEDMSDISADESTKLRGFANRITALSDLFAQEGPNGESTDTAHVYTPEWFKFAYLSEILDSSLVDITALWEDGVLKEDFAPEEVCDLVEALFADSPHRRDAIRKIRAG